LTGEATLDSVAGCPVEQRPTYVLDEISRLLLA
jgi:hypothetical protein